MMKILNQLKEETNNDNIDIKNKLEIDEIHVFYLYHHQITQFLRL